MLNQRELDVLSILHSTDEPMRVMDIVKKDNRLTQSTVSAVMHKLLHGGLVEVVGVTRSGKVLSKTYRPTDRAVTTILSHYVDSYERFRKVIPVEKLCAALKRINVPQEVPPEIDYGKIKALHKAGWSIKDIADEMKCKESTVSLVLKSTNKKRYANGAS